MSDENIRFQLAIMSPEEIAEIEKRAEVPDGVYDGTILGYELAISGTGQGMIKTSCAPVLTPGDPATAFMDLRVDHYTILPMIVDEDKFAENATDKVAEKQKIRAAQVTPEMVAAYRKTLLRAGINAMTNYAQAVFGYDQVCEIPQPRKTGERGAYFDSKGTRYTAEQRAECRTLAREQAQPLIAQLCDGTLDISTYTVLVGLEKQLFDGQQFTRCAGLYASCPADKETYLLSSVLQD